MEKPYLLLVYVFLVSLDCVVDVGVMVTDGVIDEVVVGDWESVGVKDAFWLLLAWLTLLLPRNSRWTTIPARNESVSMTMLSRTIKAVRKKSFVF
jgi:hypothetical protein